MVEKIRLELDFERAQVLECGHYVSKSGNAWCRLTFLDTIGLDVYQMAVFGDSVPLVAGVELGEYYRLVFLVEPDRNGGVRTSLSRCERL